MPGGVSGVTVADLGPIMSVSWFGPPASAATLVSAMTQITGYLTSSVIGQIQGLAGLSQFDVTIGATGGRYPVLRADVTAQRNAMTGILGYS